MPRGGVLVDTSVWVRFFRGSDAEQGAVLSALVRENRVWMTSIVRAELLSGTRDEREYRLLDERLSAIPMLKEMPDLWDRVAQARFRLARKGYQSSLVDLTIAVSAHHSHVRLWTLDLGFRAIQEVIPLKFFLPK